MVLDGRMVESNGSSIWHVHCLLPISVLMIQYIGLDFLRTRSWLGLDPHLDLVSTRTRLDLILDLTWTQPKWSLLTTDSPAIEMNRISSSSNSTVLQSADSNSSYPPVDSQQIPFSDAPCALWPKSIILHTFAGNFREFMGTHAGTSGLSGSTFHSNCLPSNFSFPSYSNWLHCLILFIPSETLHAWPDYLHAQNQEWFILHNCFSL